MNEQEVTTSVPNIEQTNTTTSVASINTNSAPTNSRVKLDKIGIIILVVTLVIGLLFLILGIVFSVDHNPDDYSGNNNGGYSNNNDNNVYSVLNMNSVKYEYNTVANEYYY